MNEEDKEAVVTARDYTIIELRREACKQSRRMFWVGVLVGAALATVVTLMWVK